MLYKKDLHSSYLVLVCTVHIKLFWVNKYLDCMQSMFGMSNKLLLVGDS